MLQLWSSVGGPRMDRWEDVHMIDVARKHQLRIARDTLRMSDVGALIMGGMTKDEARAILAAEKTRRR